MPYALACREIQLASSQRQVQLSLTNIRALYGGTALSPYGARGIISEPIAR